MSGAVAANGSVTGVAPDAKLVVISVCGETGNGCQYSDIISGLEWCTLNKSVFNISVISMSFGGGLHTEETCDISSYEPFLSQAYSSGLHLVASSGNSESFVGINAPACSNKVTGVAIGLRDGTMAGGNRMDALRIVAPTINPTAYVAGNSGGFGGTSASAAVVSGSIALVLQYVNLTGNTFNQSEVEDILNNTGFGIYDSGNSNRTYSVVDVYEAISVINDTIFPELTINSPINYSNTTNLELTFNITVEDNLNLTNVTLWHNFTDWHSNSTNSSGINAEYLFTLNFTEGIYLWGIVACDVYNE